MNAVLVVNKAAGPTSFDVIRELKKVYPGEKIGHAGSLDPFATGVIVILFGKATKLSGSLLNADKSYRGILELGKYTNTLDSTGEVVKELPVGELTEETVRQVLRNFEGEWWQTPPMFSAKKIQGVRLYELARKKLEVEREKVPVELFAVELLNFAGREIEFAVHCSKGTYIRSLAAEIGERLNTCACLKSLQRLSCGEFTLQESLTLEEIVNQPDLLRERGFPNYVRLLTREGMRRADSASNLGAGDLPKVKANVKSPHPSRTNDCRS